MILSEINIMRQLNVDSPIDVIAEMKRLRILAELNKHKKIKKISTSTSTKK